MFAAGVFGTVAADICSHHFGQAPSGIGLALMLLLLRTAAKSHVATSIAVYGCAAGQPVSTLLTGTLFVAILLVKRGKNREVRAAA